VPCPALASPSRLADVLVVEGAAATVRAAGLGARAQLHGAPRGAAVARAALSSRARFAPLRIRTVNGRLRAAVFLAAIGE
jgi:hypothetical protein